MPIAGGIFEPLGFTLSPAIAAAGMSASSLIVAVNAVALKRLRISAPTDEFGAPRRS